MNALLYTIIVMIWGTTWYVIKVQLQTGIDIEFAISYRFIGAGLILLPFVFSRIKKLSLKQHGWLALQGFSMFGVNFIFLYYAASLVESGLMALAYSIIVLFNIFNGALFFNYPLRINVIIGGLIGTLGLFFIFLPDIMTPQSDNIMVIEGVTIALFGTFIASIGNLVAARNQKNGIGVLTCICLGMLYGGLSLSAVGLASGKNFSVPLEPVFFLSMAYMIFAGSLTAFFCYLKLIGNIGPDRAAYVVVLTPILALPISAIFENFCWCGWTIVGVLVVMIGNIIVLLPKNFRGKRPFFQPKKLL